jgi:uncharacterized protein
MIVADTSAWIEWLINSRTGKALIEFWPSRDQLIVPTIVELELAKWLAREKREFEADYLIALTQKCVVQPLTSRLALLAAENCRRYKLATADAIIYTTAEFYNADLLTCDAHFAGLPSVRLIPKAA